MDARENWRWAIRTMDGRYLHENGETVDHALEKLGLTRTDVKRYMPVKALHAVRVMPVEVKEHLKKLRAERGK
jgi:hypothetical protein